MLARLGSIPLTVAWRASSSTCVTGLIAAASASQPRSSTSGVYAVERKTARNTPCCISGPACWVRNVSAMNVPHSPAIAQNPAHAT